MLFCYGSPNKIIQLYSILINLNLTQCYNEFYKILNSRAFFFPLPSKYNVLCALCHTCMAFFFQQSFKYYTQGPVSTTARGLFANTIKFVPNIFATFDTFPPTPNSILHLHVYFSALVLWT